ncbi:MAG TPA: hypothetical protein VJ201_07780 [Candidatus Babeliales bacterium]|nr:hypothetical protein [Candidatus Babeliales bacterium]HLC07001.1 hypothetical protein [Candidatus Babeliales bacterium]
MKFCWRITKYNPKYRNENGVFLNDEWCIYSEIGKTFNSNRFDFKEYARIEKLYIDAIELFMECHNIASLQIDTLEKKRKLKKDIHNTDDMVQVFQNVEDGDWVEQAHIKDLCKLILRDKLWYKLKYSRKMFVHFGWDFYMYIGSSLACDKAITVIKESGLFVELFKSPYE